MPNKSYADAAQIEAAQYGFQTLFNSVHDQFEDPVKMLAMEIASNADTESYDWFGDVPGLSEWISSRPLGGLRADNMKIGNFPFASGIRIKKWDILDDKMGKIAPRIATLAQKAALAPGYLIGHMLLKGHAAITAADVELRDPVWDGTAYDGLSFFNAAHLHEPESSYTYSNVGTAALAHDSYNAARVVMKSYKDNSGKFSLRVDPRTLIVGPSLERTAREIVHANIRSDAETSSVGIDNVMQGSAEVLVVDALSGSYAAYWALADLSKPLRPFIWQVRDTISSSSAVSPDNTEMFNKADMLFGAEARWGFGGGAPIMLWSSDGTT